jgi:hypothetical protein
LRGDGFGADFSRLERSADGDSAAGLASAVRVYGGQVSLVDDIVPLEHRAMRQPHSFMISPFHTPAQRVPFDPWVGQRVIMLKGMGEVHLVRQTIPVLATAVGINLVAPVARRDGPRLWIVSTSGGDSGTT